MGAIVSFIPIGQLASKIGRKKTIHWWGHSVGCRILDGWFLSEFQSANVCQFRVSGYGLGGD